MLNLSFLIFVPTDKVLKSCQKASACWDSNFLNSKKLGFLDQTSENTSPQATNHPSGIAD